MKTSRLCRPIVIRGKLAGVLLVLALGLTPAGAEREDPLVAFKFGLEIEGKLSGFYTSVSGIGSESEVLTTKVTNPDTGETIIQAIPGRLTWLPITLRRGVTSSMDAWEWRRKVVRGDIDGARTNCSIVAFDQANNEVARWNLDNAWPSKMVGPSFEGSEYMIEEIVIVHEGVERVN